MRGWRTVVAVLVCILMMAPQALAAGSASSTPSGGKLSDVLFGGLASSTSSSGTASTEPAAADVSASILQVDASAFPQVTLYMTALDAGGAVVEGFGADAFSVTEGATGGKTASPKVSSASQGTAPVSMELVLDASASMADSGKLDLARGAISGLLSTMDLSGGDAAGLVSFSDQPYLASGFTYDASALEAAASAVTPVGYSATCDAIEAAVWQASTNAAGSRSVVVITDGIDDASRVTYAEAGKFASSCGIPVYILGIGSGYDASPLRDLAAACGGGYVDASAMDAAALSQALVGIYSAQRGCYALTFTCTGASGSEVDRTVSVSASASASHSFSATRAYASRTEVASDFAATYRDAAFAIPDSDSREIAASELDGMSLSELRIAYDEIFARHGRAFDDPLLAEWFDTRTWYLQSQVKYGASYFDSSDPSPISQVEYDNAMTIETAIQGLLAGQVFPDAGTVALTGYDLCLPTDLLKTALAQVQALTTSNTQKANIALIEQEIASPTPRFSRSASVAAPTAIEPVDPRLVACETFQFYIPEYWVGRVTVVQDGDAAAVYCNDFMDCPIIMVTGRSGYSMPKNDMNANDIDLIFDAAVGEPYLLYYTYYVKNFPYYVWAEKNAGDQYLVHVKDVVEAELVDLCTGGAMTLEEARSGNSAEVKKIAHDYIWKNVYNTFGSYYGS